MSDAAGPAFVRVVTINFWGNEPPLERRLAVAERQLRALAPDIIGMQEARPLNGKDGRTTADALADALGFHRVYAMTLRWNDNDFFSGHPGGQEGLAVLSRYPIACHEATPLPEARPTEARIVLSARIDTPAGGLWFHTTHLHYRHEDGVARERQVVAVDDVVRARASDPGCVPVQIVCGDFNATPEHDEIRFLRGFTTLAGRRTHYQDAYQYIHPRADSAGRGTTWAADNPYTGKLRTFYYDRRIDYVFVTGRRKSGEGTILDARVVLDERDPDGACASDHYGVLADVQIAPDP